MAALAQQLEWVQTDSGRRAQYVTGYGFTHDLVTVLYDDNDAVQQLHFGVSDSLRGFSDDVRVRMKAAHEAVREALATTLETEPRKSRGRLHHYWDLPTEGRLAQVATMPRSSFSSRFTALTGEAPIAYLTRWRMNIAASRLREEDITAARLASELGYQSEAAFNRAFTRIND